MIDVDAAIVNHLRSDPAIAAEVSGVWLHQAPESADPPFIVVARRFSDHEPTISGAPTVTVEYLVKPVDLATSPALAGQLAKLCQRRLEEDEISVDGWSILDVRLVRTEPYVEHDGDLVWQHQALLFEVTAVPG